MSNFERNQLRTKAAVDSTFREEVAHDVYRELINKDGYMYGTYEEMAEKAVQAADILIEALCTKK